MIERILVPLDGSPLAEDALLHAETVARGLGSEILLFRVVASDIMSDTISGLEQGNPELGAYFNENEAPVVDSAVKYLDTVQQTLERKGLCVRKTVKRGSLPASAILAYAEENSIDLIVMSTHGRSGLNRLICGSVTERVLRGRPTPVMVVPSGRS